MNAAAAPAVPRTQPSTPHQRLYVRTMCIQLDLDSRYVTGFHTRFFERAGLQVPPPGADLDAVLCGLDRTQISALIAQIRKEMPRED